MREMAAPRITHFSLESRKTAKQTHRFYRDHKLTTCLRFYVNLMVDWLLIVFSLSIELSTEI